MGLAAGSPNPISAVPTTEPTTDVGAGSQGTTFSTSSVASATGVAGGTPFTGGATEVGVSLRGGSMALGLGVLVVMLL